ncbi:MAG: hypothetical protein OEV42_16165 [Deltaproteobacteria bacterium]|nr:hypothetical protein [Deltaproteobacteria bacterium]
MHIKKGVVRFILNNKSKMVGLILIILFLSITFSVMAKPSLPEGWRLPTEKETSNEFMWRDEDEKRYLSVVADFNGDGNEDKAFLLMNDNKDSMGLFVLLSHGDSYEKYQLGELEGTSWIEVMGITDVKAGKYKTACGLGYFECSPGESEELTLKNPAIDFFTFGSVNSFFYWNEAEGEFERVWMSG